MPYPELTSYEFERGRGFTEESVLKFRTLVLNVIDELTRDGATGTFALSKDEVGLLLDHRFTNHAATADAATSVSAGEPLADLDGTHGVDGPIGHLDEIAAETHRHSVAANEVDPHPVSEPDAIAAPIEPDAIAALIAAEPGVHELSAIEASAAEASAHQGPADETLHEQPASALGEVAGADEPSEPEIIEVEPEALAAPAPPARMTDEEEFAAAARWLALATRHDTEPFRMTEDSRRG